MKHLVILMIMSILSSCTFNKKDCISLISGSDHCYWRWKYCQESDIFLYYYFDNTGKWLDFEQDSNDKKIRRKKQGCELYSNNWSVIDGKSFAFGGGVFKATIQAFNDTIVVLKINDEYPFVLYKVEKNSMEYNQLEKAKKNLYD